MPGQNLQTALARAGNAVELLRNVTGRATAHGYVPAEYSNWRSEARSWLTSCAFLDQSHHMTDLFIEGPDALELLTRLGVNSFEGFHAGRAKQFVAVNDEGFYIGDAILFHLEDELFDLVGRRTAIDWVEYNIVTSPLAVTAQRELNSFLRSGPPRLYRFEVQGPNTVPLMEKLIGGALPDVKFFSMTTFDIGGRSVRALRHGMAGQAGFELFGPWPDGQSVRELILSAGEEFDLVEVGSTAYSTANLESGWVPGPVPAIFTDPALEAYRQWLPASAALSLAGSLHTDDIRDYYLTPFDLGYGRLVKFDHEFFGREALEAISGRPHLEKRTLVWNPKDVARVVASLWTEGPTYKFLDIPKARYGNHQTDEVRIGDNRRGISMDCGYIVNGEAVVSLAVLDPSAAEVGTEVTVVWGEDPPSAKPSVEPHEQTEIRATVAPCPYERVARETYRGGSLAGVR